MAAQQQQSNPQNQQPSQQSQSEKPKQQQAAATNSEAESKLLDHVIEITPFMQTERISLTVRRVLQYLCKPTKSGKVCSPEQAMRFIMLCKARGLNPWEGDAFIVGYDSNDGPEFSLITAHQAFLKRAEVHPEFDGMQSGVVVKDAKGVVTEVEGDYVEDGYTLCGGWARVHFKTRKIPMFRKLKLQNFQKSFGVWKNNSAGMIVKTAEADSLRSSFPTSLGGMYLEDDMPDAEEAPTKAQELPPLPVGRQSTKRQPDPEPKPEPKQQEQQPTTAEEPAQPQQPEEKKDSEPAANEFQMKVIHGEFKRLGYTAEQILALIKGEPYNKKAITRLTAADAQHLYDFLISQKPNGEVTEPEPEDQGDAYEGPEPPKAKKNF